MAEDAKTPGEPIHLSLLENSHAFLREGIAKALAADDDVRQWQFAIVNVVQSLELSLKTLLHQVHPVLIYDDVDTPRNTVGHRKAIKRLQNDHIRALVITDGEQQKIDKAIELRNEMMHSEFDLRPEFAAAKFFEVFAFVAHFQARHFNKEIEEIVGREELDSVLGIQKGMNELALKAKQRIEEEGLTEIVWSCPNCTQDTYVYTNEINKCYTCKLSEEVVKCGSCGELHFAVEMESFEREFEWDDEGNEIENRYGYNYSEACPKCIKGVLDDIEMHKTESWFELLRNLEVEGE